MHTDRIQRVIQMALRGEPGERDVARRLLEEAGIPESEWESLKDPVIEVDVTFRNKTERDLVQQVFYSVANTNTIRYYKIGSRKIRVPISASRADGFKASVDTILGLWRSEIEKFKIAFIHANHLYSTVDGDDENSPAPMSEDDIRAIISMMPNIRTANLSRQLKQGA